MHPVLPDNRDRRDPHKRPRPARALDFNTHGIETQDARWVPATRSAVDLNFTIRDHRAGKDPERLELEQLTALQPGLARLMPEIGARFWKAFYAAQQQLAAGELTAPRDAQTPAPLRGDPAEVHRRHQEWIADDLDPLMTALETHDFVAFERLYHEAVDFANELHRRWQKEWIVWKLPDTPPPDLDLTPRG